MKRAQPEEAFQNQVIGLARLFSWRAAHFRRVCVRRKDGSCYYETPVQADGAGFLDLVLVKKRVIYVELKSDTGTLSPEQKQWIKWLKDAGQEVYIWRPKDWTEIERVIMEKSP